MVLKWSLKKLKINRKYPYVPVDIKKMSGINLEVA